MSNYTKETAAYMCKEYKDNPTRETVDLLAKELDKSAKSVIGKLSKEGVYRREVYTTKTGEIPITKIEIVHLIAEHLDVEPDQLRGLDKSPKAVLQLLEKTIKV